MAMERQTKAATATGGTEEEPEEPSPEFACS